MTTTNGLEKVSTARRNIELLRRRQQYLLGCVMAYETETGELGNDRYEWAESRALAWALPILEAAWDDLARMRRNVQRNDQRLDALENKTPASRHAMKSPALKPWEVADESL